MFDAITTPDTDPGDFLTVGVGTRFTGSGLLDFGQTSLSEDGNGVDTFSPGSQAYVFIRNSDTTDFGSEWLLYTSQDGANGEGFVFPLVGAAAAGAQTQFSAAEADEAIFGSVNGTTVGAGEFTDTSTDFVLRTHTFIPEPSTTLLLLGSSLGLLARRKRVAA